MTNIHPLFSEILNNWRYSASHPRKAVSKTVVEKANQGIPLAAKDKGSPNVADDFKAIRERKGSEKCLSLLS